jgi:hypothetical protein
MPIASLAMADLGSNLKVSGRSRTVFLLGITAAWPGTCVEKGDNKALIG